MRRCRCRRRNFSCRLQKFKRQNLFLVVTVVVVAAIVVAIVDVEVVNLVDIVVISVVVATVVEVVFNSRKISFDF